MIITEEVKQQLYEKTAGRCIICNKPIHQYSTKWSVEHFIPRAVYKWRPNSTLTRHLESYANLFIVHIDCNTLKDSAIPTLNQVHLLKVADKVKQQTVALYKLVEPDIQAYHHLKRTVWNAQQCKCQSCQRLISFNKSTLRRINTDLPRRLENAMCVCFGCSIKVAKQRKKSRKRETSEPVLG